DRRARAPRDGGLCHARSRRCARRRRRRARRRAGRAGEEDGRRPRAGLQGCVVTRATLCLAALALAGCFDFDALRQSPDGDLGTGNDLAGADLAGADLANGSDDLLSAAPVPRLIAQAWFSNATGTTFASTVGMTQTHFEVPTAGIHDGDLVVFIGSI